MPIEAINTVQKNNITTAKTSFTSKEQSVEEKSNGTTLLLGSLAALAIAGGIYLATRGKKSGNTSKALTSQTSGTSEVSPAKPLEEKIAELKEKIRNKYIQEKREYFGNRDKLGGKPLVICNNLGQPNFACSIEEADKVLEALKNDKNTAEAKKILEEFSKTVRAKLTELSKDTDWVEMRKLRKNLIKSDLNQNSNGERLHLINEILFAKVNGKSKFLGAVGLSVDDAIKMVKDTNFSRNNWQSLLPQTPAERTAVLNTLVMRDGSKAFEPLTKHHFGDFNNIDLAAFTVRENNRQIKHAIEWKEKFPERLKKSGIAERMRQSDEVKELKQLLGKAQK